MNHVLAEGAQLARAGWLMGVMTAVFLAWFVGWTWWAYSKGNRARMDEAAMLPLDTGEDES